MRDKSILLIVDQQKELISGSLAVEGGKEAMDALAEYIAANKDKYAAVWITVDWHPFTHISFKQNGGEWPTHCIQHSQGAAIYQPILDAIDKSWLSLEVFKKGNDENREDYSIFNNLSDGRFLRGRLYNSKPTTIDVCGLALDYCVKETIVDGFSHFSKHQWRLLKDYTSAIGNAEETISKLDEIGLKIK